MPPCGTGRGFGFIEKEAIRTKGEAAVMQRVGSSQSTKVWLFRLTAVILLLLALYVGMDQVFNGSCDDADMRISLIQFFPMALLYLLIPMGAVCFYGLCGRRLLGCFLYFPWAGVLGWLAMRSRSRYPLRQDWWLYAHGLPPLLLAGGGMMLLLALLYGRERRFSARRCLSGLTALIAALLVTGLLELAVFGRYQSWSVTWSVFEISTGLAGLLILCGQPCCRELSQGERWKGHDRYPWWAAALSAVYAYVRNFGGNLWNWAGVIMLPFDLLPLFLADLVLLRLLDALYPPDVPTLCQSTRETGGCGDERE